MGWYWAVWFLFGFGVPEGVAVWRHRTRDTLSGTVWRWCDVLPGQTVWQWTLLHALVAVCLVTVFVHLMFKIFP